MEVQRAVQRTEVDARSMPDDDASRAVFMEFVQGLQMISTHFERMLWNFGQCAAYLVGQPDMPERLKGMMEFARQYHAMGVDAALGVIEDHSGVPAKILYGEDGKPVRFTNGLIVGLVGAHRSGRDKVFDGVACIEDNRGREQFVAVSVDPNGFTQVHRDQYDYDNPDLISDKPIEVIFPRTPY